MPEEAQHGQPRYSVARFVRPYLRRLGGVFAVMLVGTFLGLLHPWFVQQLIDRILLARRPELLWMFAALLLGVAVFRFVIGVLQAYVYAGVTARILLDMRRDFLEHLQKLSLRFFSRVRFGDIIVRFNRDLSQLQEIATGALLGFITSVLTLIGTIAWACWYDWRLFLMAAAPFPLAVLCAWPFRGKIRDLTTQMRQLSGELASRVVETITGIRTVRSYGRERHELARFMGKSHALIRALLKLQLTSSFATGLPRMFVVVASVILYIVGGKKVISGEMQLGGLVAMGMYVTMVYAPLMSIIEYWLQLVQARVSLERVRGFRELAPEVVEPDSPKTLPEVRGEVQFKGVGFRYRPDTPLLEGLEFVVAPGETVALVGASGAGKSTVLDLLFRFLDPQRGTVELDGHDLRELDMRAVRRRISVVTQSDFLFHASLAENIRFGRRSAGPDEVARAATVAGIDGFLEQLPEGLETLVGERGLELSAGQRQRVSIARALLRRPSILVLDEATSALDYEAEREIRERLQAELGALTTIVVTHRLEVLDGVDRVLVLEGGRIIEEGAPAELLARDSRFRAMREEPRR